jgi:hypothetical protein
LVTLWSSCISEVSLLFTDRSIFWLFKSRGDVSDHHTKGIRFSESCGLNPLVALNCHKRQGGYAGSSHRTDQAVGPV